MLDSVNFEYIVSNLSISYFLGRLKAEKFDEVNDQIKKLVIFAEKTAQLKLSPAEFAYLKVIAFTSAGKYFLKLL